MKMSGLIKKDKHGIIIDPHVFLATQGMNELDAIRYRQQVLDPDGSRARYLESLIESPATMVNNKNRSIKEAVDEFQRTMDYNQKLMDKGFNPNNAKDASKFKRLDPTIVARALSAFSGGI